MSSEPEPQKEPPRAGGEELGYGAKAPSLGEYFLGYGLVFGGVLGAALLVALLMRLLE